MIINYLYPYLIQLGPKIIVIVTKAMSNFLNERIIPQ